MNLSPNNETAAVISCFCSCYVFLKMFSIADFLLDFVSEFANVIKIFSNNLNIFIYILIKKQFFIHHIYYCTYLLKHTSKMILRKEGFSPYLLNNSLAAFSLINLIYLLLHSHQESDSISLPLEVQKSIYIFNFC